MYVVLKNPLPTVCVSPVFGGGSIPKTVPSDIVEWFMLSVFLLYPDLLVALAALR
jgi:hypothetical protein